MEEKRREAHITDTSTDLYFVPRIYIRRRYREKRRKIRRTFEEIQHATAESHNMTRFSGVVRRYFLFSLGPR